MRPDTEDWHDKFVKALQGWQEVISAQVVTGASSYVLTVRARSLDHFSDFVMNRLHRETGVMSINSSIGLSTLKRDGSVLELANKQL